MKADKTILCIVTSILLMVTGCRKSENAIQEDHIATQQIDSYLSSLIDTAGIPGIAIALTNGQDVIYAKGFGFANIQAKEKLTPSHFFHVASISKTFTATAVMQLAEQGKLDINRPLIHYLPYLKMKDPRYRKITIKQMLNHTSGIPDVTDYEWEKAESDEGALERYTRSLADSILMYDPGSSFNYSNIAFDVLGDVVAKVSGVSFEKYEEENILVPLDMDKSNFYYPKMSKDLQTVPYTGSSQSISMVYPYNRKHAPSSTLTSNVLELSHWAIANMYEGRYKNRQIITPSTFRAMTSPTVTVDPAQGLSVGLCWFIYPYKGYINYVHEGGDIGYRSILSLIPEKKLGVVILSNTDHIDIQQVYFKVVDMLLADKS